MFLKESLELFLKNSEENSEIALEEIVKKFMGEFLKQSIVIFLKESLKNKFERIFEKFTESIELTNFVLNS